MTHFTNALVEYTNYNPEYFILLSYFSVSSAGNPEEILNSKINESKLVIC